MFDKAAVAVSATIILDVAAATTILDIVLIP
jgi:hypothetical protein